MSKLVTVVTLDVGTVVPHVTTLLAVKARGLAHQQRALALFVTDLVTLVASGDARMVLEFCICYEIILIIVLVIVVVIVLVKRGEFRALSLEVTHFITMVASPGHVFSLFI
jgi:hypothetical protein